MEKTEFDDKLKNIDRKILHTKQDINKKLEDLAKKVKLISRKGLTENLINKYSILNGAKYFSSDRFQNYLAFLQSKITPFRGNSKFIHENLQECQMKILKIHLRQNSFAPIWLRDDSPYKVKFNKNCLRQDSVFSS